MLESLKAEQDEDGRASSCRLQDCRICLKINGKPLQNFNRITDIIQFTFSKLTFTAVQKMDWRKPFRKLVQKKNDGHLIKVRKLNQREEEGFEKYLGDKIDWTW